MQTLIPNVSKIINLEHADKHYNLLVLNTRFIITMTKPIFKDILLGSRMKAVTAIH